MKTHNTRTRELAPAKDVLTLEEELWPQETRPRDNDRIYLQLMIEEISPESQISDKVQIEL